MSLFSPKLSRRSLIGGLLALSACGFEPALQATRNGKTVTLADYRGRVLLPEAKNPDTFALRNELVSYFGEPTAPLYDLKVNYSASSKKLAITQNSVVTRYRITAKGNYTITRLSDGQKILNRSFHRVASYSSNANVYAADQTRVATRDRLARAIADDIAVQFMVAVNEAAPVPSAPNL